MTYDRNARSTFRVARAQRVLAEALPDLVTLRADPVKTRSALSRSDQASPLSRVQIAAAAQSRKPDRVEPEPLRIDRPLPDAPTCKARPERSKGNGGSRAFVPWCNRR